MADVGGVEAEEFEGDVSRGGVGIGIERDRYGGEVVEGDERSGGGDVADIGSSGAGVEWGSGVEDDDRE